MVDPWPAVLERFDAARVASELGVSASQLSQAYWFLVERGIDREPPGRPGVAATRPAPLSAQARTRDAPPGPHRATAGAHTPLWPLDGRQRERAALYDQGPAGRISRSQLRAELEEVGLYPHAVHVAGEGESEKEIVERLVEGLLGRQWADEVGFTDLGGSGSASRLSTMVSGFTTYAQRTVVIVDSEGAMAQYVTGLTRSGKLPEEDVLRFKANLEDSNFSPEEMLQVLLQLAATPEDGRPPVTLTLPLNDVLTAHKERCQKTRDKPGLAGTLLKLAEDPGTGVTISKPDFARGLADRILADLGEAPDEQAIEDLRRDRPLLAFVLDRVLPVLADPHWP